MKNYCGSFLNVEPGFSPLPGPMPIPGPGSYPVMMPRPCVPVPLYPIRMDYDMPHYEPPPPPILDLSVRRPHRLFYDLEPPSVKKPCRDSLALTTVIKSRRDSAMSTVSEDSNINEQGLDLTCPDKHNSGKTFKKAMLNRYSK